MRSVLSPKEFSQAINRSESSIKRWVDNGKIQAEKTDGGHRKISIEEAVRFVRTNKIELADPEILGFPDLRHVSDEIWRPGSEVDRYFELLTTGQIEKARGYLIFLYLSGMSVADICDGPITQALERIGELWKHNGYGIAVEHRATDICINALNVFRATFQVDDNAPVAIGGAPPDDPYIIPSTVVATTLLSEGIKPINFGANTPFEVFHTAIDHHKPMLVWLSISYIKRGIKLDPEIQKLAQTAKQNGAQFIIGGQAWEDSNHSAHPEQFLGIFTVKSMVELIAFLKGMKIGSSDI